MATLNRRLTARVLWRSRRRRGESAVLAFLPALCHLNCLTLPLSRRGVATGGIWVFIPPKSAQVYILCGKNDVRTAIQQFYTPKNKFLAPPLLSRWSNQNCTCFGSSNPRHPAVAGGRGGGGGRPSGFVWLAVVPYTVHENFTTEEKFRNFMNLRFARMNTNSGVARNL